MKRVLFWIAVTLIFGLCLKGCVKKDIPEKYSENILSGNIENILYPDKNKNVEINGVRMNHAVWISIATIHSSI